MIGSKKHPLSQTQLIGRLFATDLPSRLKPEILVYFFSTKYEFTICLGHTDNVGTYDTIMKLPMEIAVAVVNALISKH